VWKSFEMRDSLIFVDKIGKSQQIRFPVMWFQLNNKDGRIKDN
jgi:hypothetical protein